MKAVRFVFLALLLGFVAPALALVAVPALTGRVVDRTGTLSGGDIAALTQKLADLETRKGSQIAVLIVPTTDGEAIEAFSLRVAEAWKIGRKKIDDGALLVVAKNDRRLRMEVGYGLEGALTDVTTKRIIDEVITPKFKSGDFAGGISDGVDRMIALVNGEKLPEPAPAHWGDDSFEDFNPVWIFAVVVVSGMLRGLLGRFAGSAVTGGVVTIVAWLLFSSLLIGLAAGLVAFLVTLVVDLVPSLGGGGGRSGSSSGGWSGGGSSSSSGGFSGGGGSFGGGGSSGSW